MSQEVSQILVLGAAGAIIYMANQKQSKLEVELKKPKDPRNEAPTQQRYEEATSNNKYLQYLMQSGYQPRMTMGTMGVPMYLYPKPGGMGYWVVRNPHMMVN